MKVLVLGAASRLGPYAAAALERGHDLLLTDVRDVETRHRTARVDVASAEDVLRAAAGMEAIVNCSVVRPDRRLAWDVNARGCYNTMRAAAAHGIRRVVNTGPHFTLAGPTYESFDTAIGPDVPPHPGTNLYALSKSVGQEVCRLFTETHDVHVLMLLFYNFRDHDDPRPGRNHPFAVTWRDAAEAVRLAVEVPADRLPSRCEVFNVFAQTPHEQFSNDKTLRLLGWRPRDAIAAMWRA